MKKTLAVILSALSLAGCCLFSSGEAVKISVFGVFIKQVAEAEKCTLTAAALKVKAEGVTGFDAGYSDAYIPVLVHAGLEPCNFYGFIDFLSSDNGRAKSKTFVASAAKWGVPRIMCIPSSFPKGCDEAATFNRILAGLKFLVAEAKKNRIQVTVEDFGGDRTNPCSQSKYLKRFLTEIPDLGFALDSGNLYYAGRGDDIVEMAKFAIAQGRLRHVHLKDQTHADNHKYATLGAGAVPNEALVKLVQSSGYAGWYTLENMVGDPLTDLRKQVSTLHQWLR